MREAEKEEEGGERLGGSHVERRRECQLLNTYPLSQRVWRGTVPCCNSLIKTNNTHTHTHAHSYATCFTSSACINRIKSVCYQIPTIFSC